MPRTTKNTGAAKSRSTSTRSTAAKSGAAASTKRKTTTTRTTTRKPAAKNVKAAKGGSRLKIRVALTLLACLAIIGIAVCATIFYDSLVPVKKPLTVKNRSAVVVAAAPEQKTPAFIPTDKPEVTPATTVETRPDKTPVTDGKPGETTVITDPAKPETPVTPALVATATPTDKPATVAPPIAKSDLPKLAIIIDDMGNDLRAAKKLQNLQIPLTFSILPYSVHAAATANNAPEHIEIMVHVPMQAINGDSDNEKGVLRTDMTEAELAQVLREDILRVPRATGINNHTGSLLTQQPVPMQVVMFILKEKNMFFVDSVTTDKSLANSAAMMVKVPTVPRDVFLDHVADKAKIKAQLYLAVRYAKQNGFAVAIGHPRELTLEVLLKELPELQKEVEFVKVSELVK